MRRLLLLFGFFCLFAGPSYAACPTGTNIGNGWTRMVSISKGSTDNTNVTTSAITTCGNLAIMAIGTYLAGPISQCTPDDTDHQTWVPLTIHNGAASNDPASQFFYVANPITGSSKTFTCNCTTSCYVNIKIAFYQTASSSPVDRQNGAFSGSTTTLQTGTTNTLSAASELILGECTKQGFDTSSTTSFDSGMTTVENVTPGSGTHTGSILADLTQAGTGALNPTCTIGASDTMAVSIATFKQSGAVTVIMTGNKKKRLLLQ